MRLILTIHHFYAGTGGAEGFAVSVVNELIRRGHQLCIVANDGTPLDGAETVFGSLDLVSREKTRIGAALHIDWGLNVPADLHRLGGGTHRQFLAYALQAYPQPWRFIKKISYKLMRKHRRTAAAEQKLVMRPEARFLAVSEFVAEQLRRCAEPAQPRVYVLHNGVDINRFSSDRIGAKRTTAREALGLSDDNFACLFVAHNLRLKNFSLLKTLFSHLYREDPRFRLILLGKRSPGVSPPWLIYAKPTSTPETIYAAADLLLHPTYYDACANVVLEALASGLPVVSSDRNGSAEIMENGREGYVLPVSGEKKQVIKQWSDSIRHLALDSAKRLTMAAAARQLAQKHSLEAYVDQFETILKQAANDTGDIAPNGSNPHLS